VLHHAGVELAEKLSYKEHLVLKFVKSARPLTGGIMKTNRIPKKQERKKDQLRMTEADLKALVKLSEKAYKNSRKDGYQPEFV